MVPDMKLSPNVGSDRSWVWNAAADVSEGEPEASTLAIRFANAESKFGYLVKGVRALFNTFQTPTSSRKPSSRRSRRMRSSSARRSKPCAPNSPPLQACRVFVQCATSARPSWPSGVPREPPPAIPSDSGPTAIHDESRTTHPPHDDSIILKRSVPHRHIITQIQLHPLHTSCTIP